MATTGLEVFFCAVQNQLKRPEDALVCVIHWTLVKEGFKCVANGEVAPENVTSSKGSEMLPAAWNDLDDLYHLIYVESSSHSTFLLKIIRIEGSLLVHLMKLSNESIHDVTFNTSEYVTADLSSYDSAFQNADGVARLVKTDLVDQFLQPKPKAEEAKQPRQRPEEDSDPLRVGRPLRGRGAHPGMDPFNIGTGDLDPLGARTGGGMIFDPLRSGFPEGGVPQPGAGYPGALPRGSVPPGARFDPFGPPDLDRSGNYRGGRGRSGPDPDHMPMPGYDDYYM
ncbi:hypothetical protein CAPTEDRAFT_176567 [Capitella teleta]|uniref:Proteasome inhibitor PI31 subunit n=1 Tax=Capitella teleta TaxID=283909 RepID=R7V023_CAPTE|nr:hypothetical protein CAPTEDRAFT_176567 [Capitella teleta]|eukprot:ELU09036.1 hypothetical protein CAPTEDRAFT_176567 [Capitella teleta]